MTDQEIKDLARKYAEENPPQTEDEVLKQNGIELNATEVFEPFLHWLLRDHCIVSRPEAADWVYNTSCFMPSSDMQAALLVGAERLFGKELFKKKSEI